MPNTQPTECSPSHIATPRLSEDVVARWLDCLSDAFGYPVAFPFARLRTPAGRRIRVCVPLLAYTHLTEPEARRIRDEAGREAVQIRYLTVAPAAVAPREPTISMIPLRPWADAEDLWRRGLSANMRKKVRRCERDGLTVARGRSRALLDSFYALFLETMHRHGTPPFPRRLFQSILDGFDAEIIRVDGSTAPIAAYFVIYSREVALFQWAGMAPRPGYAGFLGEWAAIQGAMQRHCAWFDLGRAGSQSPPFAHKALWRPTLFKPAVLPPPARPIYDKYRFRSAAWRRLPAGVAARLGPILTPHLTDF